MSPDALPPAHSSRGLFARLGPPDPIWMREMRQAQRATRTPWILLALTVTLSLALCGVGGVATSQETSPATIGATLFQVFFSAAYAVVALVGPAVAANGIAAEREGRTWEAVLLAGLDAPRLARGKFLAAYTTISLYIVTLAPVGALSFLYGGVTVTEVVLAFALLFAFAALAVSFGLAVSSLIENLRGALVATLALAIAIAPVLYLGVGVGGGELAHRAWPAVDPSPIWLPLALVRAELDATYVIGLVLIPTAGVLVVARFLHCVTVSNLGGATDDRSTGLTRWMLFTTPVVLGVVTSAIVLTDSQRGDTAIFAMCGAFAYAAFMALLFVREPHGPTRRVRVLWARERASALTRLLGPGLTSSAHLVFAATLALIGAVTVATCALVGGSANAWVDQARLLLLAATGAAFLVFVIGLGHALRACGVGIWPTRALVVGVMVAATTAPWLVAVLARASAGGDEDALMLASPSPLYAFYMFDKLAHASHGAELAAGLGASLFWMLLGVALTSYAAQRAPREERGDTSQTLGND